MNQSGVKNMVVLKNLPSNIVEEAIIVLKANSKIRQDEKVENKKIDTDKIKRDNNKKNDYILKEAEMLVSNYITKLEKKKKEKKEIKKKINNKCKRMKKAIIIMGIIILIETIFLIIR